HALYLEVFKKIGAWLGSTLEIDMDSSEGKNFSCLRLRVLLEARKTLGQVLELHVGVVIFSITVMAEDSLKGGDDYQQNLSMSFISKIYSNLM
ncbi:hypothetical protein DVA76_18105, partial [Acinetobacter baumannii]